MSVESKVGLFFFLGILVLAVATFRVEDVGKMMESSYTVKTHFTSASGLEEGNPVAVAGVKVGKVTSVKIAADRIEVEMEIKEGVVVKQDSLATITLGGLLGDKYVDISLGSKDAPALKPGDVVASRNPPDLNEMVAKVVKAVNAMSDFSESFAEGKDFFSSLKEAGPKLNKTLDALQEITEKINAGEGTIGKLVKEEDVYK